MAKIRFGTIDLLKFTAYAAVCLWLASFEWWWGILGVGFVLGLESSRGTTYPVISSIMAGLMWSILLVVALSTSSMIIGGFQPQLENTGGNGLVLPMSMTALLGIGAVLWLSTVLISLWFVRVIRSKGSDRPPRPRATEALKEPRQENPQDQRQHGSAS